MQQIWARLEAWLQANAPEMLEMLQPGALDEQIVATERALGIQFPDVVRQSYRIHNGQTDYGYGLINGRELLSLERIQQEWEVWYELLTGGEFADIASEPDAGVRSDWWNACWIPLTYDGAGNHDCLDLAPGEGGTVGAND